MKQTQQGFTLIELMVTVAIVGILAGIAYPSYQDSVMKSRRADAKGVVLGLANAMERRFTETNSYLGAATGPADMGAPGIYTIPAETATYYTITISVATASSYTLSAAPAGVQSTDECGTLTLTHTGSKGVTDAATGVTAAYCW
ncbi:type IV pilin protein [Methylobacter tundripaludum]|uniref:General secretion pathway protein H n=1 Tax=Methylobacter tundripaludum (strain ATCC BAA-1195 / DSM 17260 / SV96) TaxID=697282 RepID=G3IUD9_METTV|nr:type IV pilin protein [Methylobacter tundripaludum]EGW21549.1 general secretion pathway protein H [Methylobacter tundripaludum SV96]